MSKGNRVEITIGTIPTLREESQSRPIKISFPNSPHSLVSLHISLADPDITGITIIPSIIDIEYD